MPPRQSTPIPTPLILMTMMPMNTSMVPIAIMATATTMNEAALYRLMAWLSPSYPVGAFSYSHGLEWLVETHDIHNADSLSTAIADVLRYGSGRNDAIFFVAAHRAVSAGDLPGLEDVIELAGASVASAERCLETLSQGRAFAETTSKAWRSPTLARLIVDPDLALAYPAAVAIATADHKIDLRDALAAYLHGFAANLVSAGVRLIPLGHTAGQVVLTQLEKPVADAVAACLASNLDDIGGAAAMMDLAAMKHETQYTRLFRS